MIFSPKLRASHFIDDEIFCNLPQDQLYNWQLRGLELTQNLTLESLFLGHNNTNVMNLQKIAQ